MYSQIEMLVNLLQQMRDGKLSYKTLWSFLALPEEERMKRFVVSNESLLVNQTVVATEQRQEGGGSQTAKFELLIDLGEIIVPENYRHESRLTQFREDHRKKFYDWDNAINDENFPHPSCRLEPGKKIRVRAFRQTVDGRTTSEERMAFLKSQPGNVFVGAQGASLVWEQKRHLLLGKGYYWYQSFDEKERLWTVSKDNHRVPGLGVDPGGYFIFYLGCFEEDADQECSILSFCEVP